jgi:hypothetical protein
MQQVIALPPRQARKKLGDESGLLMSLHVLGGHTGKFRDVSIFSFDTPSAKSLFSYFL